MESQSFGEGGDGSQIRRGVGLKESLVTYLGDHVHKNREGRVELARKKRGDQDSPTFRKTTKGLIREKGLA